MLNTLKIKPRLFTCIAFVMLLGTSPWAIANNISINVFAIPSQPIIDLMQRTSDALKLQGLTSFYAQGKPVHVTLYLTEYERGSEAAIKRIVAKIAQQQQAFAITAEGFTVSKGNWAFINVAHSAALQKLADEVVLALSPLRDKSAALPDWAKSYPNKVLAFKRYGSPNVLQNFQPHLTLLANESSPQLTRFKQHMQAQPPAAQGQIIGIGIGIADHLGQQQQVIAEYFFNDAKR
jgi:2'-5' RNA ligase